MAVEKTLNTVSVIYYFIILSNFKCTMLFNLVNGFANYVSVNGKQIF